MTVTLDNTNAITFFFSLLKMLRVDILDKFELPGIGVTYWDFLIGLAITAVVLTVLVNTVRIGSVNYANSKTGKGDNPVPVSTQTKLANSSRDSGEYASYNRQMYQKH